MNASHHGPKVLHGHPRCPEISQAAIRVWLNSRAILKLRKGSDMVCARGPLGACVATYGKVDKGEGPLPYQKRSFAVIEPALGLAKRTEIA